MSGCTPERAAALVGGRSPSLPNVRRRQSLATGIALGVLTMLLAEVLGVRAITGVHHPVLLGCLAMAVAAAIAVAGYLRWILALDLALIAIALVAVTPVLNGPIDRWVRQDSLSALAGRPADAIVVLSGGMQIDSAINAPSVERLLTGLELFQRGYGRRLVTTRVGIRYAGHIVTTDSDQARLVHLIGADSAWAVVGPVTSTRAEAVRVARLFMRAPQTASAGHTIVLVTSPMHTRRACASFEAVGFTVMCRAAREREYVTWPAVTTVGRLAAFRQYAYERLGMIEYKFKGWVR